MLIVIFFKKDILHTVSFFRSNFHSWSNLEHVMIKSFIIIRLEKGSYWYWLIKRWFNWNLFVSHLFNFSQFSFSFFQLSLLPESPLLHSLSTRPWSIFLMNSVNDQIFKLFFTNLLYIESFMTPITEIISFMFMKTFSCQLVTERIILLQKTIRC